MYEYCVSECMRVLMFVCTCVFHCPCFSFSVSIWMASRSWWGERFDVIQLNCDMWYVVCKLNNSNNVATKTNCKCWHVTKWQYDVAFNYSRKWLNSDKFRYHQSLATILTAYKWIFGKISRTTHVMRTSWK